MSQDTNVNNLIINKLTKQQYEGITNPDPTQLYFITDDNGIASLDDISLSSLSNGQILKYNSTSGKWENANLPAEVTETTVTNWGFTKNVGTVTSVNNVSPVNGNVSLTIPDPLPTQTGNSGKFLTTNGTAASWATVDALPSQTSQSGKFLTTNGTTASWANVPTEIPTQTGNSGKYLTTNGSAVSWASISIPSKVSDLTDDTATYPVDKADTLTGLTASITELNYVDGVTSAIQTQLDSKLAKTPDGTNNIIDTNNKITTTYIPDFILGQMLYAGTFVPSTAVATLSTNAKTKLGTTSNTITLTNNTTAITGYQANEGNYYICSADGTFASISFVTGDWLVSTGSAWQKIDNTDAVTGVKGNAESTYRTGNVNITADNVLPTQTSNSGKFLTTNGTTVSWATVDALPSQTSQSGKFLTTNGTTASWADVPTEIPTQTGNSGKYLTTNGTTASWATISIPTVDQTYDSTSTNAQSGVAIAGAGFLQNTATGTNALTILGTAATSNTATNVGTGTSVTATAGTAIGRAAEVSGTYGTGLGTAAKVTAAYGIQIGYGTNSTASTLSVGFNASSSANRKNWQLLDGTTGYIPNERINMDTTPTSASTNTVTSGGVYTALSDKVEYAMVITDYTA